MFFLFLTQQHRNDLVPFALFSLPIYSVSFPIQVRDACKVWTQIALGGDLLRRGDALEGEAHSYRPDINYIPQPSVPLPFVAVACADVVRV